MRRIEKMCTECDTIHSLLLTDDEYDKYRIMGSGSVGSLNKFEREFLKSGICAKCQELLCESSMPMSMLRWDSTFTGQQDEELLDALYDEAEVNMANWLSQAEERLDELFHAFTMSDDGAAEEADIVKENVTCAMALIRDAFNDVSRNHAERRRK